VLRFDLRPVPAFIAAQAAVAIVTEAVLQGTAASAWYATLQLAATFVVAWTVTTYLVRAGTPAIPFGTA
jgi:hypothetical protein